MNYDNWKLSAPPCDDVFNQCEYCGDIVCNDLDALIIDGEELQVCSNCYYENYKEYKTYER